MTEDQKPYAAVTVADAAMDGAYHIHTPLVLRADVWPEDANNPASGWQVEHSINGYSLGFDTCRTAPDADKIKDLQRSIVVTIRDLITGVLESD